MVKLAHVEKRQIIPALTIAKALIGFKGLTIQSSGREAGALYAKERQLVEDGCQILLGGRDCHEVELFLQHSEHGRGNKGWKCWSDTNVLDT
jgi:hypothetical protein